MPWKDVSMSEQRIRFVLRASDGENMSGLCREFGISRPTGYLWLQRFREVERIEEVKERSRRPKRIPGKTSGEIEAKVVEERKLRPDWGARKLRVLLERQGIDKPAVTIHRILQRHNLIKAHHQHPPALKRFEREKPNQLWQMDFKGMAENLGKGCLPLSILDDCSRYVLVLAPLRGTAGGPVRQTLERVFQESGMPEAMLVDHGTPWWNANQNRGWTQLSIWLMKQNIRLHYSAVRHPQTQGKVERFHRTLEDALHERGFPKGTDEWPGWLEAFREEYNHIRPHEGIQMEVPGKRWHASSRHFSSVIPEWEYGAGSQVVKVRASGQILLGSHDYMVTGALAGEWVELQPMAGDRMLINYRCTCIRELDLQKRQSYPVYFSKEQQVFDDD